MKIFITGATGYIGGSLAKTLVDEGHIVFGLVRNKDKSNALLDIGIEPVLGSLEDNEVLSKYAKISDAIINTANSDHKASIKVILTAIRGSGKTFIHSSGSSIVGDDVSGESTNDNIYTDDTPFTPMSIRKDRTELNHFVRIAGIQDGIRTMVITPPMN